MAAFPLQILLEVTQKKYDDAERKLQQANALLQAEKDKLQLIIRYRKEYEQKLLSAQQAGLSVTQWRDFQLFIGKLDEAITQQEQTVQRTQEFVISAHKQWEEQRKKLKGFEMLAEQHQKKEAAKENKREQKQADEFASKVFQAKDKEEPTQH